MPISHPFCANNDLKEDEGENGIFFFLASLALLYMCVNMHVNARMRKPAQSVSTREIQYNNGNNILCVNECKLAQFSKSGLKKKRKKTPAVLLNISRPVFLFFCWPCDFQFVLLPKQTLLAVHFDILYLPTSW